MSVLHAYRRDYWRIWVAGFLVLLTSPVPFLGVGIAGGFVAMLIKSSRGEPVSPGMVFHKLGRILPLFWAGILQTLVLAPAWALALLPAQFSGGGRSFVIFSAASVVLSALPLWLGAGFSLTVPLVVDGELAGSAAMRQSWISTRGRRTSAIAAQLGVSAIPLLPFVVIPLVDRGDYRDLALPAFIGLAVLSVFVLWPLAGLALAQAYDRWMKQPPAPNGAVVAVLGAFGWAVLAVLMGRFIYLPYDFGDLLGYMVFLPLALYVAPPPDAARLSGRLHRAARLAQPVGVVLLLLGGWLGTADLPLGFLRHAMWPALLLTAGTGIARLHEERRFTPHDLGVGLAFLLAGLDHVSTGTAPVLLVSLLLPRLDLASPVVRGAAGAVVAGGVLQVLPGSVLGLIPWSELSLAWLRLAGLGVLAVLAVRAKPRPAWALVAAGCLGLGLVLGLWEGRSLLDLPVYGMQASALFGAFLALGIVGARPASRVE